MAMAANGQGYLITAMLRRLVIMPPLTKRKRTWRNPSGPANALAKGIRSDCRVVLAHMHGPLLCGGVVGSTTPFETFNYGSVRRGGVRRLCLCPGSCFGAGSAERQ